MIKRLAFVGTVAAVMLFSLGAKASFLDVETYEKLEEPLRWAYLAGAIDGFITGLNETPTWLGLCLESVHPSEIADAMTKWSERHPEHSNATASSAVLVALQEACTGFPQ